MQIFDATATALALPWLPLVAALERTLADAAAGRAQAPERWVLPVAPGTSWFLMPAWLAADAGDLAAIKLITYASANPARGLPSILGDVLVLRASTGLRLALLDGPTVTARRTAAVTLLAALRLAPAPIGLSAAGAAPAGPLLVIGTGVQALAHVQALVAGAGVREVWVRGRTPARSREFVQTLQTWEAAQLSLDGQLAPGLQIAPADDLALALKRCRWIVTATPAAAVCLHGTVRDDAFVAAVGAFKPAMIELDPALTRQLAAAGRVVLDSAAARHEAGDLLAAGLDLSGLPTLAELLAQWPAGAADQARAALSRPTGPVLFKSCGASLWDLAAARCAVVA
jgi:1-piperideine-2-carboxylate/1-pyrroline-2-carboxylate reductase [NAD(P)H]